LTSAFRVFVFCAAAGITAGAHAFAAEPMVRLKAKLTAFDGQAMSLEVTASPNTSAIKQGDALTVSVLPGTRYVGSEKASLDTVNPGDYAGAAVTEDKNGGLKASDVYVYAPALRGSGEGRFTEADRLIVNGTVSAIQPVSADGKKDGSLTLHYRGAVLTGLGKGRTLCEGRASPPAFASALACEGDAVIAVPSGASVSALTVGDKSLLSPGRLVTVAMTKGADGKNVTPGVIVDKTSPVEKPQSSP